MNKIIYVIRHCKALGQEKEAELTEEGKQQALELSQFLSEYPIKKIISSPYKRAIDTIKPYAEKRKLNIIKDERLGERILSSHASLPDWLKLLEQSFLDFSLELEGGESSNDAINRVKPLIEEVKGMKEEHIVLVSHGNLTTLLLKLFDEAYGYREWKAMTNPDVYMIHLTSDEASVMRIWS